MLSPRSIAALAVGFLAVSLISSCSASSSAGRPTRVTSADIASGEGYEPIFNDGYVVFYDLGRPYYHERGVRMWIPAESPRYAPLMEHYRTYGPHYAAWYAHYGHDYHHVQLGTRAHPQLSN